MPEIIESHIENEMQSSYIDYAMSVIIGRALPDVRDGLKPVHRRILYAMKVLNNVHSQPTKKSARVVGETMGKYHPHGDMAIYDALVRMAQDFSMNHMLVEGQGNMGCFTKDTRIRLADGRNLNFGQLINEQLNGGRHWTFAINTDTGMVEIAEVKKPRLTRKNAELVEVALDNGEKIRCTPDHRFMLRDGIYVQAKNLTPGTSLMPVYFKVSDGTEDENLKDYEMVMQPKLNEWTLTHHLSDEWNIKESVYARSAGARHHKDFNKRNNNPDNIVRTGWKEHRTSHYHAASWRHKNWKNEAYKHIHIVESNRNEERRKTKEFNELIGKYKLDLKGGRKDPECRLWMRQITGQTPNKLWQNPVHRAKNATDHFSNVAKMALADEEYRAKGAERARAPWRNHEFRERGIVNANRHQDRYKNMAQMAANSLHKGSDPYRERIMRHKTLSYASGLLSRYQTVTPELYNSERKNNRIPKASNAIKYFNGNFRRLITDARTWNHKVVSVRCLKEREDVYDITTDAWHNFALSAGVFVHNSIDGDAPAAQRYTEVRLTKLAEEMLEDLDKEAVKMAPNFDNTEEEPTLLPAKVPNLLINGSSGIAVGVATNILPHNLAEVCDAILAYIANAAITSEELLSYVKGPDFPTGGTVFYNEPLLASYLKGRGGVVIRGRVEREKIKNREALIVTEIPYTVNKASLVSQIAELAKEKKVVGISDLRDESGKEGIRITIELRQDAEPEYVLNQLYKHSQLQISLPVMNIAVLGNSLLTMPLKDFIRHFVEHRVSVIRNRSNYDLRVARDRLHIVNGLIIAVENIERVIEGIKGSRDIKEARSVLMLDYSLSEKQANAILEMKLSKLTGLERGSLETEQKELGEKIMDLESILSDPARVTAIIRSETEKLKSDYGRPRRTNIDNSTPLMIEREDLIQDDDITIILTNNNYIKRIDSKVYKEQARGGKGVIAIQLKEGDFVKQIVSCRNKDYLLVLTNTGRAYWLKAYMVPEEGRYGSGKAAINLINFEEGEKAETIINTKTFENSYLTFITTKGKIKKVAAESFSHQRSNGIRAINMLEGDSLADVCLSDGRSELFIATRKGKALRFAESDLRPMGRTAVGVRAIKLATDDVVLNIIAAKPQDQILSIAELGYGKITALDEYRLQRRGGKGVLNIKIKEKTGLVVRALNASNNGNLVLINSKGVSISFPTSEIRVTGRAASGVRLMRMAQGVKVVDAQVLPIAQINTGTPVSPDMGPTAPDSACQR